MMYYKIVLGTRKYLFFYFKKTIHRRYVDEAGIPKPVGDRDVVQFLILDRYKYDNR